jgi:hypothetical protein
MKEVPDLVVMATIDLCGQEDEPSLRRALVLAVRNALLEIVNPAHLEEALVEVQIGAPESPEQLLQSLRRS